MYTASWDHISANEVKDMAKIYLPAYQKYLVFVFGACEESQEAGKSYAKSVILKIQWA